MISFEGSVASTACDQDPWQQTHELLARTTKLEPKKQRLHVLLKRTITRGGTSGTLISIYMEPRVY